MKKKNNIVKTCIEHLPVGSPIYSCENCEIVTYSIEEIKIDINIKDNDDVLYNVSYNCENKSTFNNIWVNDDYIGTSYFTDKKQLFEHLKKQL